MVGRLRSRDRSAETHKKFLIISCRVGSERSPDQAALARTSARTPPASTTQRRACIVRGIVAITRGPASVK